MTASRTPTSRINIGTTALHTPLKLAFSCSPDAINKLTPSGGVSSPSVIFRVQMIPNCIKLMPAACAIGYKIGT